MDPKEKIIWVAIVLVLAGAIVYVVWSKKGETPAPTGEIPSGTVCAMDAKLCPDGSYVGRQGPKCEFTPCPGPSVEVQVK